MTPRQESELRALFDEVWELRATAYVEDAIANLWDWWIFRRHRLALHRELELEALLASDPAQVARELQAAA